MDFGKDLVAASATPLVLAILAEGDSYGYAIIKRVTELSGGHLQWTDGMLYPVLHRLERQGLVEAQVGHLRNRPAAEVLPHHAGKAGRSSPAQRQRWTASWTRPSHAIWMRDDARA